MAESPYRGTYSFDDEVREPNDEERALIARRREEERKVWLGNELGGAKELLVMAFVAAVAFVVAAVLDHPPVMFGAGLTALLCGGLGGQAYRRGLARLAERTGRWGAPADQWRTHVTRIRARSVLHAASEDEDYITWIVFEIPGSEWAAIDDLWLPPGTRTQVAKEDLRITWLEPNHECLGVQADGAALPRHGAVRLGEPDYDGDDFAKAIEDGFGWGDPDAYEEGIDPGEGPIRRVPESELAPWMRDAVRES